MTDFFLEVFEEEIFESRKRISKEESEEVEGLLEKVRISIFAEKIGGRRIADFLFFV